MRLAPSAIARWQQQGQTEHPAPRLPSLADGIHVAGQVQRKAELWIAMMQVDGSGNILGLIIEAFEPDRHA